MFFFKPCRSFCHVASKVCEQKIGLRRHDLCSQCLKRCNQFFSAQRILCRILFDFFKMLGQLCRHRTCQRRYCPWQCTSLKFCNSFRCCANIAQPHAGDAKRFRQRAHNRKPRLHILPHAVFRAEIDECFIHDHLCAAGLYIFKQRKNLLSRHRLSCRIIGIADHYCIARYTFPIPDRNASSVYFRTLRIFTECYRHHMYCTG